MGWLDNLWRRRQDRATETEADRAAEQTSAVEPTEADLLEEEAHAQRDEAILREPRLPPGVG